METKEKNEAVLGGREITVETLAGVMESVLVKHLKLRQLYGYSHALESMPERAELLTGKTGVWIDGLTDDSVFAICEAGDELNFTRAARVTKARLIELRAMMEQATPKPETVLPTS